MTPHHKRKIHPIELVVSIIEFVGFLYLYCLLKTI